MQEAESGIISEEKKEPNENIEALEDTLDEAENDLEKRRAELNLDTETALLETVLFLESEPQTVENLSKITKMAPNVIEECIERLKEKYSNANAIDDKSDN